jgi:hypothetical protein
VIRLSLVCALLCACGGPQSVDPCQRGGKAFETLERLSGVAAFVCSALGGDSEKCQRHTGFVELAADTFGAGCELVAR